MSRLLFLLAIIAVVVLLLRAFRKSVSRQETPAVAEDMVRCAKCGVHLPKSESFFSGGNYYCSEAHRREHQSR